MHSRILIFEKEKLAWRFVAQLTKLSSAKLLAFCVCASLHVLVHLADSSLLASSSYTVALDFHPFFSVLVWQSSQTYICSGENPISISMYKSK